MMLSYVVTGGGRGVGRAIVEQLLARGDAVVVVELDPEAVSWVDGHPADRLASVLGSAADEAVADRAANRAEALAPLGGWVNDAAVFRDTWLHETSAADALDLVALNLAPTLTGRAVAVRRLLAAGTPGSIVNVSSHQAQRPVRGALPYASAKAAVEGLTRALAVDYGPQAIRVNAVALGSIATERSERHLAGLADAATQAFVDDVRRLHPLGRMGAVDEVAEVVAFLLSDASGFVTGTVLPVDGGRAALGLDPEEA